MSIAYHSVLLFCFPSHYRMFCCPCYFAAFVLQIQEWYSNTPYYCNSLLANLLPCSTNPLQLIQNTVNGLVCSVPKCAQVTPLLILLNWLPITAQI